MGKVVKLEPSAKPDKTALVLGGGGFTGGVYEIGALRALDLLATGTSVNDFDVYVGTSAGSFIAALCANDVTPEEMMHAVTRESEGPFREIDLKDLLHLNLFDLARRGALLPVYLLSLGRRVLMQRGQTSLMDLAIGLAEALPAGLYSGAGLERYLQRVLADRGVADDFRSCRHELYITATDLDTCERVVFGEKGFDDVPISTAVRASTALPMVYAPVTVGDRELVDGGIVSTTNLDIAVQAGAKLVIVINPIVPYHNHLDEKVRTLHGTRPRRISDMGFSKVGYQAFKLLAHRRLHGMAQQWQERYPGVDIVLIEPRESDRLMFETSIMNFTSRVEIARHGFESVARHLSGEYETYREIFERHGIEISAQRVRRVIGRFEQEAQGEGVWRSILGAASGMLHG
jgi:predicted acylesterase/phospholipase RssA